MSSMDRQRLRVCVVGLRGFPDVMGGIETHCQCLYPRLAVVMPNLDFTVYGRSAYVGGARYTFEGVQILPLPTVKKKGAEALIHTLMATLHAAFFVRPALLHVHAIGPALMIPLARLLGLPVVATHHGQDYQRAKWGAVAKATLRLGEAVMVRLSRQIICVSAEDAQALRARYPRRAERIHFIPNGFALPDRNASDDAVLDELGLQAGGYVLAVGRLVPEKGFHDLIAAHRRAGTGRRLVIVGGTDHPDAYSRSLLAQAGTDVVFAGVRSKPSLRALYEQAAMFVLPSYHEGLPLVALEALMCRCPCLLSDIAANRQIGLPAANYFPVGNVDALARQMAAPAEALALTDTAFMARFEWADIVRRTAVVLQSATVEQEHAR